MVLAAATSDNSHVMPTLDALLLPFNRSSTHCTPSPLSRELLTFIGLSPARPATPLHYRSSEDPPLWLTVAITGRHAACSRVPRVSHSKIPINVPGLAPFVWLPIPPLTPLSGIANHEDNNEVRRDVATALHSPLGEL